MLLDDSKGDFVPTKNECVCGRFVAVCTRDKVREKLRTWVMLWMGAKSIFSYPMERRFCSVLSNFLDVMLLALYLHFFQDIFFNVRIFFVYSFFFFFQFFLSRWPPLNNNFFETDAGKWSTEDWGFCV